MMFNNKEVMPKQNVKEKEEAKDGTFVNLKEESKSITCSKIY